jgi:mannose-6-phosphate isomerase-like protein (cupin superfamily)
MPGLSVKRVEGPMARGVDQVEVEIVNIHQALEEVEIDQEVGIRIATLGEILSGATRIRHSAAQVPDLVEPHVHFRSPETYLMMQGHGLMHFGVVEGRIGSLSVEWLDPKRVGPGDVFTIPAGVAHSLQNLGNEPLVIEFSGSPDNLSIDRTTVALGVSG